MKNFYKVSNIIENGPRMDRVKSRISPINHRIWSVIGPMLFVVFGLFGVNVEMWGATVTRNWQAGVAVNQGKGTVKVTIYKHDWGQPDKESKYSIGSDATKQSSSSTVQTATDTETQGGFGIVSSAALLAISYRSCWYEVVSIPDGYSWLGWYDGSNTLKTSDQTYKPWTKTKDNKNETYYAKFNPITYTITLDKQEGTGGDDEIKATFDANTNLTSGVSTPSRPGYVFKGYYTEANGEGTQLIDANGNVLNSKSGYTDSDTKWIYADNLTLVACWKAIYTITFDANGGNAVSSMEVVSGDQYGTLPTTTRTGGYNFAGWFTSATGGTQVTSTMTVTGDQTLHAHWLANYSVAFNANGGNGSMAPQGFVQGTAQNLKDNKFTRTGYTFAGWATSADGNVVYSNQHSVNNLSSTGNATVNLFAKWTANTYYVSFSGNGSTSGSMSNQTFSYDETKSLSSNTYAKSYTVTFNGNSGTPASSSLTATAPFLGWATSENGDKAYNDKQSVSNLTSSNGATVPLYAKWGTGSITLPTATRSAYHLDGWYLGENKVGDAGQSYTPTSNVELTAHWTQSQLATSFNGSDQSMNVDDVQNSAFTLSNAPSAQVHIAVTSIDDVTDGSGKVIEYNAATNTITAHNAGVATIYFTQAETEYVTGGTSATWTYTVTKKDPSFTGSAYNGLKVDDVQEADYSYSNVSASAPSASSSDNFYYTIDDVAFAKSAKNKGNNLVTYNPSTKEITACNAGTGKITLHQKETYKYNAGSKSFNVTVSKYDPSFIGSAYNGLKVEEVQTVDYSSSNTSSAKPSASSSDAFYYTIDVTSFANESLNKGTDLATYDAASNTLTPKNAGTGSVTFHQSETYKYNPGSQSFAITIGKWDNAIYVKGSTSYSGSTSMTGVISGVTLTATNTDYTNSPFEVEQTEGDNVALYDKSAQTITAIGTAGTATWSVSQPENYKYAAANGSFSVTVTAQDEAADCYVLNEPSQRTSTHTFDLDARGKMLYIDFRRSWGDTGSKIKIIGISSSGEEEIDSPDWDDNWTRNKSYNISSKDYTQIKVELSGGVNTKYYENLKVTRKTWLNASNATINKTSDNKPIYPSDGTGVGSFTIDYSIANGGDLKIYNDNPKFTLSQTTISNVDCKTGSATINIQYNSDAAGTDVAHLVIYNDVYRKEVTITGTTIKRDQVVNWEVGNVIRLGSEVEDAAWVITGNPVRYESSDSTKIDIVDGKLVAKGVGSAVITATADGSTDYYAASGTKTIEVTNDLIQSIVWTQDQDLLRMNTTTKKSLILNAYATSDVAGCATNGARPITYTSADESVVRIDGTNQLVVVGVGRTTVTATQDGSSTDADGHKYMTVSETKTVVVRDPNAPCINYQYVQEGEKSEDFGISLTNPKEKDVIKLINIKEPDSLILRYRGENKHVGLIDYYNGNMTVNEYYDGQWHIVEGGNLGTPPSDGSYGELKTRLNRKTTEVSVHVTQGRGYHKVTGMKIGVARYIEKTNNLTMFDAKVGQQLPQTLTIKYNNIVGPITLQLGHAQSNFSLSQTVINGECGDKDTKEITIYYTPSAATSHEEELLTISDGVTSLQVTLEGRATVTDRYINWAVDEHVNVYTVDTVKLSAQSLATVGNTSVGSVYYVKDGTASTTGNISNDSLTFANAGVAKITALGVADPKYSTPVGVTRYYHAALTPTEVVDAPTIGSVVSGTALSDITVSGGTARNTINQGSVSGTFTVQNGNVTDVGPNKPVTVKFTPEDGTMYDECTYNMYIEVTQRPATDEEIGTVTAGHITFGEKLSDAVLSMSGTLNGHGTLVMTDPQKDEVKDVDTYENLKVLFTPGNTNIAPKELTVSVTVDEANPAVTPQATDITYGQPISASNITTASGDVAGSWAWAVDDTQVLSVGDHVLKANFTSDSVNYNNLSNVDVTLKVKKIETLEVEVPLSFCAGGSETFHGKTYTTAGTDQINAVGATRDTVYNVTVTVLQPTTGTDSKTITVGDNESWHGNDLSGYAVGSYEVEYHTTNVAGCDSTVTLSLTVNAVVPVGPNTFTGNGEWETPSNWSTGIVPTTAEPDIIVVGQLVINEEKTVGGLTILPTGGVTIVDDGKLTVNGITTTQTGGYGDIHVKDDGALVLGNSADLQVRDFMLDAKLGDGATKAASGQVRNEERMNINGEVYFQLSFDPSNAITFGWYDFAVPFAVNINGGISRIGSIDDRVMVSGVDFLIMEDDEVNYAAGGKGWRTMSNSDVLVPGKLYTITFNYQASLPQNTFQFAWNKQGTITNGTSYNAEYIVSSDDARTGWNAIGNGMLCHGYVDASYKLQTYNHTDNVYEIVYDPKTFAVGTAFFVQVLAAGDIDWTAE